ncbi:hypothetical protein GBA52_009047 [Prunus armeniaca]|nr:hypothetical protein GBA52_009047 [Prunus armeniaca]
MSLFHLKTKRNGAYFACFWSRSNCSRCPAWTDALHTASMANDIELVKIILDAGVDVNIRNVQNTIPLHVALARGAKSCVGLLLSSGANYNLQDDEGDNAFHIAADAAKMIHENLEWLIVMLRNPDASVEARNHRQETDWELHKGAKAQGAKHRSVGFVQGAPDKDHLLVSFCSGEVRVLANEVVKVIPLDRGQHVQLKPDVKEPSGLAECSGSNVTEPSPVSHSEVFHANPTLLHRLVSEGDVHGVRDLLEKAAAESDNSAVLSLLEAQNADGQTALHLACRRGSAELVDAILEHREANVDVLDKDGDPPLVFALVAGSPECVRALINRGANVRSRLREGFGPSVAHVCAYHGQPDCMRELLMAGADPNAVDEEGESVLHRAVAKKYTDCALVVLENGGSRSMSVLNSEKYTPLHLCVATWNVAVVRRWVEVATPEEIADAIDIPSSVGTALCMAAALKKDHEIEGREMVHILLASGADPTAQDAQHGRTALHTASMANDVGLVKIILDAGVDVNIRNVQNTIPLHVALAKGAKSCVGLLLSSGANYNLQVSLQFSELPLLHQLYVLMVSNHFLLI